MSEDAEVRIKFLEETARLLQADLVTVGAELSRWALWAIQYVQAEGTMGTEAMLPATLRNELDAILEAPVRMGSLTPEQTAAALKGIEILQGKIDKLHAENHALTVKQNPSELEKHVSEANLLIAHFVVCTAEAGKVPDRWIKILAGRARKLLGDQFGAYQLQAITSLPTGAD